MSKNTRINSRNQTNIPSTSNKTNDLSLPQYLTDNLNIPISQKEIQYLNRLIQPQNITGNIDFSGDMKSSLQFYSDYDDLQTLIVMSNEQVDVDELRGLMAQRNIVPSVFSLNLVQLLEILLLRIKVSFKKLKPMYYI